MKEWSLEVSHGCQLTSFFRKLFPPPLSCLIPFSTTGVSFSLTGPFSMQVTAGPFSTEISEFPRDILYESFLVVYLSGSDALLSRRFKIR